jgi:hypothetical protein
MALSADYYFCLFWLLRVADKVGLLPEQAQEKSATNAL